MTLEDAAWNLLDALRQAQFARGLEEQQEARWAVTTAEESLRQVLTVLEEVKR